MVRPTVRPSRPPNAPVTAEDFGGARNRPADNEMAWWGWLFAIVSYAAMGFIGVGLAHAVGLPIPARLESWLNTWQAFADHPLTVLLAPLLLAVLVVCFWIFVPRR